MSLITVSHSQEFKDLCFQEEMSTLYKDLEDGIITQEEYENYAKQISEFYK